MGPASTRSIRSHDPPVQAARGSAATRPNGRRLCLASHAGSESGYLETITTDTLTEEQSLRAALAPYAVPRRGQAISNLLTSVVPYLGLIATACVALRVSYLLAAVLSLLSAGFLIRTFIVFHDCAHGSFLPSKRMNGLLGASLGVLVYTPFAVWRREHAVHHATAGDLDRRGVGDVQTLTVVEYQAKPWWGRLAYRLFRNPLVMFGLGPLWVILVKPRFFSWSAPKRLRRSVLGTNLALAVVIASFTWLLGWTGFIAVQLPALLAVGSVGIWLFYVQHQFEDAYWEPNDAWSFDDAALKGSSYLRLPRVLQFLTGNIGLHHVHHLNARIPNYNLQAAHDANHAFRAVPEISLRDGLRATRLKLWDEQQGKLVGFAAACAPPPRVTMDSRS